MVTNLGQNFLIDKRVAEREIGLADLNSKDVVLEIGPGKGILTSILSKKAKKVIAIEIDKELYYFLQQKLPKNVILINKDVLKTNLGKLPKFNKIVSNLPFEISSPVTFKLLNYPFDKAILVYQKDFADRMVAKPNSKNYSRLSVNIYYKTYCRTIEIIPRTCFFPQPKVDACVVELIKRKNPPFIVKNEELFFNLTKLLFNYRRKKIGTISTKLFGKIDNLPYSDNRVEDLTPEQIGNLCDFIFMNCKVDDILSI